VKSKEIYDELLLTSDLVGFCPIFKLYLKRCFQDSPEYADLENNSTACEAFLEFASAVPSSIADLQASDRLPSFSTVESTMVGPLVAAEFKTTRPAVNQLNSLSQSGVKSSERKRKSRLPARIAALPEEERPPLDLERWLPKRERLAYKEQQAAIARKKQAGEKRKEKITIQGASSASTITASQKVVSSSGSNSKKKKKGKK